MMYRIQCELRDPAIEYAAWREISCTDYVEPANHTEKQFRNLCLTNTSI
jgi:hypothetical protein